MIRGIGIVITHGGKWKVFTRVPFLSYSVLPYFLLTVRCSLCFSQLLMIDTAVKYEDKERKTQTNCDLKAQRLQLKILLNMHWKHKGREHVC